MENYCATNVALLSESSYAEENPIRLAREALGLSQTDLTILAAEHNVAYRDAIKASIAGLEGGVFRDALFSAPYWHHVARVFADAGFNVVDLDRQVSQWHKDRSDSIADEVKYLVANGKAKPGPK